MATTLDKKIKKVDNTSPMGGGTFLLQELTIMSPSSPSVVHLNSPGLFEQLDIYEDLFSNVLRGTCLLYTSPSPRDLSTARLRSCA